MARHKPGDIIRRTNPKWLVIQVFENGRLLAERTDTGQRKIIRRPELYEKVLT